MIEKRTVLPVGTMIILESGSEYEISGSPIGFGGGSILYPARRKVGDGWDGLNYALKECFPLSAFHNCIRSSSGEILPQTAEDSDFLLRARHKHLEEGSISQAVYQTASRVLPIRDASLRVRLRLPGQEEQQVENTVTIMDSLSAKGHSIVDCIREQRRFAPWEAFRILAQLLAALNEVHQAGFLHLDIQDGNVFLRGTLEAHSELLTLIDFGSARPMKNGKTAPISDRVIYTSPGYSAPEILLHNDGTLQLGPEADLYSAGCLAYFLLTGHRADTRQFLANRTGRYLRPNDLRRIQCPAHLVERMQEILTRALAPEPENRYHSASEMLTEVNELTAALQPYRTELNNVKYDAFICYKHGPIDSTAAISLQKYLEEFRYQHKKPFHRVFVDEGELSSCADFGQQIREALKNSGWLIVVCSPDTPASPWVQREIDAFLETHDRSRILAVLTSGEASEAFPPQLLGDGETGEVLAADARGDTIQAVKRKLRRDVLLKLAAPMLGTTFDTLKQRQKTRQARRIAGISLALMAATLCVALYAADRAAVIRRQADQLAEEYRNSLISESRILIQQAEVMVNNYDPQAALSLLLRALPSKEQDRPALPEASALLAGILNVYHISDYDATPEATSALHFNSNIQFLVDEHSLYTFSSSERVLSIWDAVTFQKKHTFSDLEIVNISENLLIPESDLFIVIGSGSLFCLDSNVGVVVWNVEIPEISTAVLSEDGKTVYAFSQHWGSSHATLTALSTENGQKISTWEIPLQELVTDDICISKDEKRAAFRQSSWLSDSDAVYLVDLESEQLISKSQLSYAPEEMLFDNNLLLLLGYDGDWAQIGVFGTYDPGNIRIEARSADTLELIWSVSEKTAAQGRIAIMHPEDVYVQPEQNAPERNIIAVYADRVILVNEETGAVSRSYPLPASVCGVNFGTEGMEAVIANGSLIRLLFSRPDYVSCLFSDQMVEKAYSQGTAYYLKDTRINTPTSKITRFAVDNNPNCISVSPNVWDGLEESKPQLTQIAADGTVTDETGATICCISRVPEYYQAGLTRDGQRFWVLCKDDSIALYDTVSGTLLGEYSVLTLNLHLYSDSRMQILDDGTALLFTKGGCAPFDLTGSAPISTAFIQECTAYDPQENRFLLSKGEECYAMHRYSLEELIALAEERLN